VEAAFATVGSPVLVARAALCFPARGRADIDAREIRTADESWFPREVTSAAMCSLTYLPDLVRHVLDLIVDGERGIWHLVNRGATTVGYARELLAGRGVPISSASGETPYLLDSVRGRLLPTVEEALVRAGYASGAESSTAPSSTSASL
jgi:dTDP-4-dehydrorhamnose reductase